MRRVLIILALLLYSLLLHAQQPISNEAFPVFQPNINIPDVEENALPYYHAHPSYSYTYCNPNGNCQRATFQYAFGEGREPDDNRSNFDIYYANAWDQSLAPNGKPVVLLLPGGNGTRKSNRLVMRAISYAQRGYVAIVGDYRSARDEMFSDCLDQQQAYFAIQTAVVDARAILRRAFYLSSLPDAAFIIDPTKILLDGVSWGSLTTYHMAIIDPDEFPTGTVEILDQEYTFANNLDHIQICEDPDGICNSYLPFEGYEIKNHILGVAARNVNVLDLELIDVDDTVPTILVHGTCDVLSPFWSREFRFASYAHHVGNGGNPLTAPCQNAEVYSYTLYGGEAIYQRYLELSGSDSPDVSMRYFTVCGEDHTLSDYNIYRTCYNVSCIELNIIEYETFRFFAEILNDIQAPHEVFHLDHTLLASPDSVAAFKCTLLPGPDAPADHPSGSYWPGIVSICPNCENQESAYNSLMRFPYFVSSQGFDDQRYPYVANCITVGVEDQTLNSYGAVSVKVYDFMGYLVLSTSISGNDIVNEFLKSGHGLKPNLYAVHFGTGLRKTILIR